MKAAIDLHIHSALSPCAERDMTPNNIVNMAKLKGLDCIAVTDHNSCANIKAISHCARKAGILSIPGLEIETREEIHLICLLPGQDEALALHDIASAALPDLANHEEIFGEQFLMNEQDEVTGTEHRLLITATSLSTEDVFAIVRRLGGTILPAHVDRPSNSMLTTFGTIPEDLGIRALEISRNCDLYEWKAAKPEFDGFKLIRSSDAHCLGDILERESFLEVEELSAAAVLRALSLKQIVIG